MVLGKQRWLPPSARHRVLLKAYDRAGLSSSSRTLRGSPQGQRVAAHPEVSLLFPWYGLGSGQVATCGRAERIQPQPNHSGYFLSRPFGRPAGAWVSQPEHVIGSRLRFLEPIGKP